MPSKRLELLLLNNVENLGIVGDVVKVKAGYARNYLLPLGFAEKPNAKRVESLKEARAKAQAELDLIRKDREGLIARLEDISLTLMRTANDQGVLYGSVTQRDISDALKEAGYGVDVHAVRMANAIRRVGEHHVIIQFAKDLKAEIEVIVNADRPPVELEQKEERQPAHAS